MNRLLHLTEEESATALLFSIYTKIEFDVEFSSFDELLDHGLDALAETGYKLKNVSREEIEKWEQNIIDGDISNLTMLAFHADEANLITNPLIERVKDHISDMINERTRLIKFLSVIPRESSEQIKVFTSAYLKLLSLVNILHEHEIYDALSDKYVDKEYLLLCKS